LNIMMMQQMMETMEKMKAAAAITVAEAAKQALLLAAAPVARVPKAPGQIVNGVSSNYKGKNPNPTLFAPPPPPPAPPPERKEIRAMPESGGLQRRKAIQKKEWVNEDI
jgi:hypothetical protein